MNHLPKWQSATNNRRTHKAKWFNSSSKPLHWEGLMIKDLRKEAKKPYLEILMLHQCCLFQMYQEIIMLCNEEIKQ